MKIKSFILGDITLNPSQKKAREVFFYLVFGGLTTLVNMVSFILFDKLFGARHVFLTLGSFHFDLLGNDVLNLTIAWIVAVTFAFITNRAFVFVSKGPIFKEFFSFVTSRIATLVVFEIGTFKLLLLILQHGFGINNSVVLFSVVGVTCTYKYLVKLINSVLVVIGNYVLSKIFVFNKSGPSRKGEGRKAEISDQEECDADDEK